MIRHARTSRAFTLVELLVVVAIIILGTILLLPAFARIIESVSYSSAVNSVSATLANARAQAIRNGRHTGVVFLFDIEREVCTLQVVELSRQLGGSLTRFSGGNADTSAFVYRPVVGVPVVELPPRFVVCGLALSVERRNARIDSNTAHWYAGWLQREGTNQQQPLWLFPQNDPRLYTSNNPPSQRFVGVDPWLVLAGRAPSGSNVSTQEARNAVRHAQSFMVQFSPGGSAVLTASGGFASTPNAYLEFPDEPIRRSQVGDTDARPYDFDTVFDPDNVTGVPANDVVPNPEVVLRAVSQLAVVDLSRLSSDTGIARPWFVRPQTTGAPQPSWLNQLGVFQTDSANAPHRRVSDWIDENAEIIGFTRYTGQPLVRRRQ